MAAVIGHDLAISRRAASAVAKPQKPCVPVDSGSKLRAPKRKRRSREMEYFAGLDVSIDETSVCVVTDKGEVVAEASVATDPVEIAAALQHYIARLRRVGHEAGALAPWRPGFMPSWRRSASRSSVWKPAMFAERCLPSATRPMPTTHSGSRISCVQAGSDRRTSRPRTAIGCVCCWCSAAV